MKNYYSGKYELTKAQFLSAKYYALRFNDWLREYNGLKDSVSAMSYENADMPHAVNKISCPTEDLSIKREELRAKMDKVTICCVRVAGKDLATWLLDAVTNDCTFEEMKAKGLPIERTAFYGIRRHFYYLLAKEI